MCGDGRAAGLGQVPQIADPFGISIGRDRLVGGPAGVRVPGPRPGPGTEAKIAIPFCCRLTGRPISADS